MQKEASNTEEEEAIIREAIRSSKRARMFQSYSSSDDDHPATRSRTTRSRRAALRKNPKSTSINPQYTYDSDVEVQIINVELKKPSVTPLDKNTELQRKKVSLPNDKKKASTTTYVSPSNNVKDISSMGFVTPAKPFSEQPLCPHCENRGYSCHNKVYSTYCTKACMNYLQNNHNGWESGFDANTMEQIFEKAYNEKRRVELEENYGYYSPDNMHLPKCMINDSLRHAIELGDNPKLCDDLAKHNEGGYNMYLEAMSNHRY